MKGKNDKALKDEFTHFLLEDEFSNPAKPNRAAEQASLKQSEVLRAAQNRIKELENQVLHLKSENEELTAAGIVFQNKYDEVKEKLEQFEKSLKLNKDINKEEKLVLENLVAKNSAEKSSLEQKVLELKERLQEKFSAMKVRERELENRLILLKSEEQAVIDNKDQIILDLKNKIDQLEIEIESSKNKSKELSHYLMSHKDQIRRTMKALRLALTMLEGENPEIKKTGSDS